jgi:hypothetical protein
MRRFAFVGFAALSFSLLTVALTGCRPDAAVERGAVIDAGSNTSEKDVKKADTPNMTEPTKNTQPPLKKVQ